MNLAIQKLLASDCRTMADANEVAIDLAVSILDDTETPIAIKAMARTVLLTYIQNHPGEAIAAKAAIAVARHCGDKHTRAHVLEAALDEHDNGSDQIHTLLADLAMQRGHHKTAAYHLRMARRIITGNN